VAQAAPLPTLDPHLATARLKAMTTYLPIILPTLVMRFAAFVAAASCGLLLLAVESFATTFADSPNINIPTPAVYYVGKFCFNPVTKGLVTLSAQGSPTTSLIFLDDQPDAWPSVTATTGVARAGNVIYGSNDPTVCNSFLANHKSQSEFNNTLPFSTTVNIQEHFRRNWYFAFVNCAPAGSDFLTVSSYSITINQGEAGNGTPLSCEKIGKYELFATYFAFSFVALFALLAYAKKLGIAIFSLSAPHALVMYAFMVFTFGLIFVLADADSQRASGNIVPQGRQSFGLFLLQVADWMMLTQAFGLCTGIVSIGHLQQETNIVKGVLAAFCLTYIILSIITVATDATMYAAFYLPCSLSTSHPTSNLRCVFLTSCTCTTCPTIPMHSPSIPPASASPSCAASSCHTLATWRTSFTRPSPLSKAKAC
jgi:hypothetical protein